MHPEATEAHGIHSEGGGTPAELVEKEALETVALSDKHRTVDFKCSKSARVAGFFTAEARVLVPGNYCRVFVYENPDDPTEVWGYYTLSASLLFKENLSGSDEKKAARDYLGYPAPMVRIGFMGRSDSSPKHLGAGLIVDAARRVYLNKDIAAWGLVLEPEGGQENQGLWRYYLDQGFKPCRSKPDERAPRQSMYGSLGAFLPELQT
jgi:hypothetical protein